MDSNKDGPTIEEVEIGAWYWHSIRHKPVFVIDKLTATLFQVLVPEIRPYSKPKMKKREVSICHLAWINPGQVELKI